MASRRKVANMTEPEMSIFELRTTVREIGSALWGDDVRRDNGIRAIVKDIEERVEKIEGTLTYREQYMRHYMDIDRRKTCHGIIELEKHIDEHLDQITEGNAMTIAEIQAGASVAAARATADAMKDASRKTLVGAIIAQGVIVLAIIAGGMSFVDKLDRVLKVLTP
jgi:hypothetical protein